MNLWKQVLVQAVRDGLLSSDAARRVEQALAPDATLGVFAELTGLPAARVEELAQQLHCDPDQVEMETLRLGSAGQAEESKTREGIRRLAADLAVVPSTAGIPHAATVEPIQQIGRYQIRGLLGEGAFGLVYRAFDPQLNRLVALKVLKLPPGPEPAQWVHRFLREARAAAKLRHPGIVPVHELGTVEGMH